MSQNGRIAFTSANNKVTNANFNVRLEKLEATINNMKKESDDNLKTIFRQMQTNVANCDHLWQQISQLQELTTKDSKRISYLEENRAKDISTLKNLENALFSVTSQVSPEVAPPSTLIHRELAMTTENNLANELAISVDSVVGLREAITWKYRWLKRVWSVTLLAGIIATVWFVYASTAEYLDEPTATKVKLMTHSNYDYPSIFLCSAAWLNAPKALSLGLSLDGLKYSLGYINNKGDKPAPDNITKAKQEFLDFFDQHNFTSYTEYLMTISADIPVIQTFEAYTDNWSTNALCTFCKNDAFLSKTVFDGRMCYSFRMRLETNHRSSFERFIGIKLVDQTLGLIQSPVWTLYINAIAALRTPTVPQMAINSFSVVSVRITSEQFISLNTPESPCVTQENVDKGYSQRTCIAECLVPIYDQNLNCTAFDITVSTTDYHPTQLCNTFGNDTIKARSYWAVQDVIRATVENVALSEEAEQCYQKCPQKCQRTTYEAARQQDISFADFNPATSLLADQARLLNISTAGLIVEHAAVYQGGVMTWKEINTISFTSMVSNIGGALGLFVGGTVLTFVQLILFFVKFALDRRNQTLIGDAVFVRTSQF